MSNLQLAVLAWGAAGRDAPRRMCRILLGTTHGRSTHPFTYNKDIWELVAVVRLEPEEDTNVCTENPPQR